MMILILWQRGIDVEEGVFFAGCGAFNWQQAKATQIQNGGPTVRFLYVKGGKILLELSNFPSSLPLLLKPPSNW